MLSDVRRHHFSVLWRCIVQNPLDQVIAVLVAGNINQGNSSSVTTPFTNTVQVAAEEVRASNFEALFHNLGRELVRRIF